MSILSEDVVVHRVSDAEEDFDARFSARARCYQYRISTEPVALWRHVAFHCHRRLDAAAMHEGSQHLLGEHDFTSFTASANDSGPVCRVERIAVTTEPPFILVTVEADRFLYHMVRVIAGTLMEVGKGRFEPERMADILRRKDRRAAGPTARPHGLTLLSVRYL